MIRILLADDNEVLRWGLVQSLSCEPDLVVVAEVDETGAAVAEYDRMTPDVLILDLYMPGGGGWVALAQVLARHPDARVVILSAEDDVTTVETAIARGAMAHVSKSDGITRLLEVLRSVAGAAPHDMEVAALSPDRAGGPQAPRSAGGGGPGTR
jgi:two-component system invasion response regulator UvrY